MIFTEQAITLIVFGTDHTACTIPCSPQPCRYDDCIHDESHFSPLPLTTSIVAHWCSLLPLHGPFHVHLPSPPRHPHPSTAQHNPSRPHLLQPAQYNSSFLLLHHKHLDVARQQVAARHGRCRRQHHRHAVLLHVDLVHVHKPRNIAVQQLVRRPRMRHRQQRLVQIRRHQHRRDLQGCCCCNLAQRQGRAGRPGRSTCSV